MDSEFTIHILDVLWIVNILMQYKTTSSANSNMYCTEFKTLLTIKCNANTLQNYCYYPERFWYISNGYSKNVDVCFNP